MFTYFIGAKKCARQKCTFCSKIKTGENLLDLCLSILPNDGLLLMLESEQLPKLKQLFDMASRPKMRNTRESSFIELTPRSSGSKASDSLISNKSFLKQLTQSDNYSGRGILSYIVGGDKSTSTGASVANNTNHSSNNNNNNNNSIVSSSSAEQRSNHSNNHNNNNNHSSVSSSCNLEHYMANRSHRDSIASNKSIQSEDSVQARSKIVLDEAINPKRPLRPSRAATTLLASVASAYSNTSNAAAQSATGAQNVSSSSPSISNHSMSRPLSHMSGDEMSSTTSSSQQLNINTASGAACHVITQTLHLDDSMPPTTVDHADQDDDHGDVNMMIDANVNEDGDLTCTSEVQRTPLALAPPPPKPSMVPA